jgi:hypothetical protein
MLNEMDLFWLPIQMRLTNAVDEDVDVCVCGTLSSTMQLELNCKR